MRYSLNDLEIMKNRIKSNFKPKVPLEEDEQVKLVEYLELKKIKFTAIPNSTYTKSWKQKNKNTKMGVRSGLPDLFLIIRDHALFIELKRIKWWIVSEYQKSWLSAINQTEIKAYVAEWFLEAKEIIDYYLKK